VLMMPHSTDHQIDDSLVGCVPRLTGTMLYLVNIKTAIKK
jgi:hypothetical protein